MVHVYNGISVIHKKEQKCTICRDVDGPGDYHREWSTSEREKQISYYIACMQNLEKWNRGSYLQSRNRGTHIEGKHMDINREGGARRNWESGIGTYTLLILCIKLITNEKLLYSMGNFTHWSLVI